MLGDTWRCPVCRQKVLLTRVGELHSHRAAGRQCPGTGYSPYREHLEQMNLVGLDGDGKELV